VFFVVVAQVTLTDDEVTSVRYGALVSRALAPGRLARAADGLARSVTATTTRLTAVPHTRGTIRTDEMYMRTDPYPQYRPRFTDYLAYSIRAARRQDLSV
jgi:hypothetical protein